MNIQIASDLHLEFPENRKWLKDNPLLPVGEVLLLAGDIISDKHKKKAKFFYDYIESKFKLIISIMGNHEFYYGQVNYAYPSYNKVIANNHYKLNNQICIFEDIKIISSTLWSYIPKDKEKYLYKIVNDYKLIYKKEYSDKINIMIDETNYFNKISIDFLKEELNKNFNGKIIILTHHLPSFKCIIKDYDDVDNMKYAFASDLDYLVMENKINLWVFGHIHESVDLKIGNTRFVSNPLGYMEENQKNNFKRDFCINV